MVPDVLESGRLALQNNVPFQAAQQAAQWTAGIRLSKIGYQVANPCRNAGSAES
jgi:hypothetical protein